MLNGAVNTVFRSTRGIAATANTWGGDGGGGGGGGAQFGSPPGTDGKSTERGVMVNGIAFGTGAYSELPGPPSTDWVESPGGWGVI